jgi:protein-disulfide isomerase
MPSRSAQRQNTYRARLAIAEAERRTRTTRRRRNATLVAALAAVLVVAAALASSGTKTHPTAATGAPVAGAADSRALLAGIPQRGLVLGNPRAPVHLVEFADLQCPYCDEFATQALPQLITDYVRSGKVNIEFRNLSFIGPDSVRAARVAAGAAQQNRLWNFVDLVYLNQGTENSGYVTDAYLHRLLAAIPGLDVARAEGASQSPQAAAALASANQAAAATGVDATPSFLIGRAGHSLALFQPSSLTPGGFTGELDKLIGAQR